MQGPEADDPGCPQAQTVPANVSWPHRETEGLHATLILIS